MNHSKIRQRTAALCDDLIRNGEIMIELGTCHHPKYTNALQADCGLQDGDIADLLDRNARQEKELLQLNAEVATVNQLQAQERLAAAPKPQQDGNRPHEDVRPLSAEDEMREAYQRVLEKHGGDREKARHEMMDLNRRETREAEEQINSARAQAKNAERVLALEQDGLGHFDNIGNSLSAEAAADLNARNIAAKAKTE